MGNRFCQHMKMVKSDCGIEERHLDLPLLSNRMQSGLVVLGLEKFLTFSLRDHTTEQ